MTTDQQRENVVKPTEIRTNRARQAVSGMGVRYVLGFGLALVVIAFAIIYFANFRWSVLCAFHIGTVRGQHDHACSGDDMGRHHCAHAIGKHSGLE